MSAISTMLFPFASFNRRKSRDVQYRFIAMVYVEDSGAPSVPRGEVEHPGTRAERGAATVASFGTRRHLGGAGRSPAMQRAFSDLDASARPYCAGRADGGPRGAELA